ncbi:hypothetical protein NXC14_PA00517 (plasmid) [Rhizobium sp. NXC14]|nr:hypothetical protein NXC14_PA00517 [Rhizobium sp. NXC14]
MNASGQSGAFTPPSGGRRSASLLNRRRPTFGKSACHGSMSRSIVRCITISEMQDGGFDRLCCIKKESFAYGRHIAWSHLQVRKRATIIVRRMSKCQKIAFRRGLDPILLE